MYIVRGNKIKQITKDHNLSLALDEMLKNGQITDEQYLKRKENGSALISYLGVPALELVDMNVQPFPLQNNDTIILATDGLYKLMNTDSILECLEADAKHSADNIIKAIKDDISYSKDNTTFIIIKITER